MKAFEKIAELDGKYREGYKKGKFTPRCETDI